MGYMFMDVYHHMLSEVWSLLTSVGLDVEDFVFVARKFLGRWLGSLFDSATPWLLQRSRPSAVYRVQWNTADG